MLVNIAISLLVAAALVAFVHEQGGTLRTLRFDAGPVPVAAGILVLSLLARALRWHLLMKWAGARGLTFLFAIRLLLVGAALNTFMPAGTGDVAKSYFGYKWTGIKERMLAVSLYDKLVALAALFPFGVLAWHLLGAPWLLGVSCILMLPLLAVEGMRLPGAGSAASAAWKRSSFLSRKLDIDALLAATRFRPGQLALAYGLSVAGWVLSYAMLWSAFMCYGKAVQLSTVLGLSPAMTLGRLFPFTLNGLGTDEAVILFLFKPHVQPDLAIVASALVYRIALLIVPAMFGLALILAAKGTGDQPSNGHAPGPS